MNVRLVGYVTLSEIFVVASFGILLVSGGLRVESRTMRWLLAFGMIWIVSAVLTDIYRGADYQQFARGFGRTVVLFCSLWAGYIYLSRYPNSLKPLFLGFVVSSVINIFGFRAGSEEFVAMNGYQIESSWERNYTYITLMLSFCAAAFLYRRAPWSTTTFVVLIGGLNIAMGSRNLGGTIIAAGMVAGTARLFFKPKTFTDQGSKGAAGVVMICLLLTVVGSAVYVGYKYAAANGFLGEKSFEKYEAQAGSPLGILFASRADFIGGLLAIKDSPIIGYGSWPADNNGYLLEAYRLAGNESFAHELEGESYIRIPSHSMLLEAWVEHGVFAMMFWLVVVVILFRALSAGALQDPEWGLVNGLVVVWMIWNLLFSPFGNRLYTAIMILILVLIAERRLVGVPRKIPVGRSDAHNRSSLYVRGRLRASHPGSRMKLRQDQGS